MIRVKIGNSPDGVSVLCDDAEELSVAPMHTSDYHRVARVQYGDVFALKCDAILSGAADVEKLGRELLNIAAWMRGEAL